MKRAAIYQRRGWLFIDTMSRTEHGLWIGDGPCVKLAVHTSRSVIGDEVWAALARSRSVPHPTSWEGSLEPVLREAGVKSWNTFAKSAKMIDVKLDAELLLMPTRNEGPREGFEDCEGKELRLPATATAEELGQAIEQAFARCE